MLNNSEFKVDLNNIHRNRKPGISGMLRVKNDAEFLEESVESCIDALDELIIVYNDCEDESPEIINRLASRYPDKIRVYNYLPKVFGGRITKEEYDFIKKQPENSPHLLSNYCNYALSKTTRTHAMKIDADQIYYTDLLKTLCNNVRSASLIKISPKDLLTFYKIARKMQHYTWRLGDNTAEEFKRYRTTLEILCGKGILSVALSGLNIFMNKEGIYSPQGKITGKLNILPQFNGTSDYLLFKVNKNTCFFPYEDPSYGTFTSSKYNFIEGFRGAARGFSWGLIWWHLNSMRRNIYIEQIENFNTHPDTFIDLNCFMDLSTQEIETRFNPELVSKDMGTQYLFYWENCRNEIPQIDFKEKILANILT